MINMPVDLRTCKAGDILISKHGERLTYIKPLDDEKFYYDHLVRYDKSRSLGTRIHDGHVYRNPEKRLPTDHDIVEIIHIGERDE